jgi:hypothetical protein
MPEGLYDDIIWDDPVAYLDASFVTKIEKSNQLGASLPVIVRTGKQARSVRSYPVINCRESILPGMAKVLIPSRNRL